MNRNTTRFFSGLTGRLSLAVLFVTLIVAGCQKAIDKPASKDGSEPLSATPQFLRLFDQVNIVANNDEYNALRIDPSFVNAWGLVFTPNGIPWVNTQATGLSYVLNRTTGADLIPAVAIPSPTTASGGLPTGIVLNQSTGFRLANGNAARFIFVGVDGVISGWNGGAFAERVKDNSAWAAYTGAAILTNQSGATYLYLANFRNGTVDVYDTSWNVVHFAFKDANLPAGYSPFNVAKVDNEIYVMWAQADPATGEEVKGSGKGFVDVFNGFGSFRRRFASHGPLNAPWGIAKAPASFFGPESGISSKGAILIGNFGDGHISVFAPDGTSLGYLNNKQQPLVIDGLWGIGFTSVDPNKLYFAAGPDDEEDGLFGYLQKSGVQ